MAKEVTSLWPISCEVAAMATAYYHLLCEEWCVCVLVHITILQFLSSNTSISQAHVIFCLALGRPALSQSNLHASNCDCFKKE